MQTLGNSSKGRVMEDTNQAVNSRVYQLRFSIIQIILLGIPGVISWITNPPLSTVCLCIDSPAVKCC